MLFMLLDRLKILLEQELADSVYPAADLSGQTTPRVAVWHSDAELRSVNPQRDYPYVLLRAVSGEVASASHGQRTDKVKVRIYCGVYAEPEGEAKAAVGIEHLSSLMFRVKSLLLSLNWLGEKPSWQPVFPVSYGFGDVENNNSQPYPYFEGWLDIAFSRMAGSADPGLLHDAFGERLPGGEGDYFRHKYNKENNKNGEKIKIG